MKALQISKSIGALIPVLAVAAALGVVFPPAVSAQSTGVIAGSVTADAGGGTGIPCEGPRHGGPGCVHGVYG